MGVSRWYLKPYWLTLRWRQDKGVISRTQTVHITSKKERKREEREREKKKIFNWKWLQEFNSINLI